MKKYAMMIMGNYEPETDTMEIVRGGMLTRFVTVRSMEEAVTTAREPPRGGLRLPGTVRRLLGGRRTPPDPGNRRGDGRRLLRERPDMDQKIQEFFS